MDLLLVVDDQQPGARHAAGLSAMGRLMVTMVPGRPSRARVRSGAFCRDGPAHGLHKTTRYGEAEPRSGRHAVAALGAIETVEDMAEIFGRDANPLIGQRHRHHPALHRHAQRDTGADRRILHRILHQIRQRLFEQARVGAHREPLRQAHRHV